MFKLATVTALVGALIAPAMADDIALTKGEITHQYLDENFNWSKMILAATNTTSATAIVFAHCSFFVGNKLLEADHMAWFGNIKPGETGYRELLGPFPADRIDCNAGTFIP